jgi:hypothetical protein
MKKEFPIKPIKEVKTKKKKVVPPTPAIAKDKIPLFDPYTGEPNPNYEDLTGKINPLLLNWKKEDFYNVPQNFQPKLKNRFLVVFPKELNIKPYFVTEVKLPSMEVNRGVFGTHSYLSTPLELTMIDSSTEPRLPVLFSWFKDYTKFDLSIEQLDPMNVIIQKFSLKKCLITRVDCESMSYRNNDSDLYNYKLSIMSDSFNIE